MSFAVDAGEIMGIAGESGSGKTMTALSLFGLLPNGARVTGSIRLDGTELLALTSKQLRAIRGRQIAMVSQDPVHGPAPDPADRDAADRAHAPSPGRQQVRGDGAGGRLLETVRIPDPEQALRSYAGQFSGGMRQRIAIAVALAAEPRLLVADEPTTALDVTVQAGILRLLDRLCRERGMAVIVITHDLGVMSAIAQRLCVMYAGRLAEAGPTSAAARPPAAPVHPGAARRPAAPRGGRRAAGPHRRQPAVARARAGRLPVPSALQVRAAVLRDGPPGPEADRRPATCSPARPTPCGRQTA